MRIVLKPRDGLQMRLTNCCPALALLALLATSAPAAAEPRAPGLVLLRNGINPVELGPGARAGMVVLAHRENFNAHSFEIATFYLRTARLDSDPATWQLIPFETKHAGSSYENDLLVSGGADCVLHTFRIFAGRKAEAARILVADRAPGESFADPRPVTFTWYELAWNPDGGAGQPTAFFRVTKTATTRQAYCDADQAIRDELQLEGAITPAEGSQISH
ncbi:MAG: carbapenem self-resistance protein CarG family protein [Chthoniobacterales bacterium]